MVPALVKRAGAGQGEGVEVDPARLGQGLDTDQRAVARKIQDARSGIGERVGAGAKVERTGEVERPGVGQLGRATVERQAGRRVERAGVAQGFETVERRSRRDIDDRRRPGW